VVIFQASNIDFSQSPNRSWILIFGNISDPDPDSKILDQERSRSLKKSLWLPIVQESRSLRQDPTFVFGPSVSEISDLCEISKLLLFVS